MSSYAGLTDNPVRRRAEHGNPVDWNQHRFDSEVDARAWEALKFTQGYKGGVGGSGWRYGYTYTISSHTIE